MRTSTELAYEYRGDTLDLTRYGYLVIADENSNVIYSAGSPDAFVFYRSSSKPIQALPVIARGLDREYGLTDEESTIFAASHMGEPFHVAALESIIGKAGFTENMLVMKPTVPTNKESNEERIKAGLPRRKFYHNCSGKHLALMLTQRALGGAAEDYWKPGAPVQREVERTIKAISETDTVKIGVDGCGVPVFAVGIKHIAIAFKNLACIDRIKDDALQKAAASFVPRMHSYPHMISGTGKICTILNQDENIVAKGGANGVYGFALKKQRLGVAFKLTDGTENAWPLIVRETLRALGALSPQTGERLEALNPDIILNDNDTEVGCKKLAFKIESGFDRRPSCS